MSEVIVLGRGRTPNPVMIVGEGPGETEGRTGRPFTGRAGEEQESYLQAAGFSSYKCYVTNVNKTYTPGNPDPTPEQITRWSPTLEREIRTVNPKYIITAGVFAAKWFLGDHVYMDLVHGIPHRSDKAPGAVILPCWHPASGFYNDEARAFIAYDYKTAVSIITGKSKIWFPYDEFEGNEHYEDVTGAELEYMLAQLAADTPISIDTEGYPGDEWSIQVSWVPGTGYALRRAQDDFRRGADAIAAYCLNEYQPIVVMHNAMYDLEMCRCMGIDLFECNLWDTRYAAYIMRLEPQALKPLLYRWCGMIQPSYEDTVGDAGIAKQLDWLQLVADYPWPMPEPRVIDENDGTSRLYKPQPVQKRAVAIINDYCSGKTDKDGNLVDIAARWKQVDPYLRRMVEAHPQFGRLPVGTLADIPLEDAIRYACRDSDGTLRLYYRQVEALQRMDLIPLMTAGCEVLPIFEEMQSNGMRANRAYCGKMSEEMSKVMHRLRSKLSARYFSGRPFNPNSPNDVTAVMRRRGLVGEKRSKKTKKVSTGKKSIEHLRYTDDAMAGIIDWREHAKMRDAFYNPIAARIDDAIAHGQDPDTIRIRTHINPYKVVSRRISSSDPNLTAIPVRNQLGVQVRDGFEAAPGMLLGSWDLSQIEMRYMAHVSKDPLLVKFFGDPKLDVHCETAARIFGLKINERADTKEERYANISEMKHRYPSKRAGFGIITNIMGMGLLDQLRMFGCEGWTEDSCNDLIASWLDVYKGVRTFMDESKQEAYRQGYVRDAWGMIRYLPGVYSSDRIVRAEAERAASSMKIQGGAQGMLQKSMAWLKPYFRALNAEGITVRWILQIHDEIILEFDENAWDIINPLVLEGLTQHSMKLIVPIKASGSSAKTWGKLKG